MQCAEHADRDWPSADSGVGFECMLVNHTSCQELAIGDETMKRVLLALLIVFVVSLSACQGKSAAFGVDEPNWASRRATEPDYASLTKGHTYLPVYSHVYHLGANRPFYLTTIVSIRNVSSDTSYLLQADYYNTEGDLVRKYLEHPIFLKPLETVEIVISDSDTTGGSGAKLFFDWAVTDERNPPLFEAVMVSTQGQQGLSFSTRGVRVYEHVSE